MEILLSSYKYNSLIIIIKLLIFVIIMKVNQKIEVKNKKFYVIGF